MCVQRSLHTGANQMRDVLSVCVCVCVCVCVHRTLHTGAGIMRDVLIVRRGPCRYIRCRYIEGCVECVCSGPCIQTQIKRVELARTIYIQSIYGKFGR